jgi:hypothetical protein
MRLVRFATPIGPEPAGHPESYGRYKRAAFDDGWYAASEGATVNAAPWKPLWQREAWLAGHEAYHRWLQSHRVRACDRTPTEASR